MPDPAEKCEQSDKADSKPTMDEDGIWTDCKPGCDCRPGGGAWHVRGCPHYGSGNERRSP